MQYHSYPQFLLHNYIQTPNATAIRAKQAGIWRQRTWGECYRTVEDIAAGLDVLGLAPGERVILLGDDGAEWFCSDLAIQAVGGVTVPLGSGCAAEEIAEVVALAEAQLVFAENQEQVDKLLVSRERLPALRRIVYWDGRGVDQYDDEILLGYAELCRVGAGHSSLVDSSHLRDRIGAGVPEALARIQYQKVEGGGWGSVAVSHRALIESSHRLQQAAPLQPGANLVSTLPGGSICQAWLSGYCLMQRVVLNFPEGPQTLLNDYREISPQLLFLLPPQWEDLATFTRERIERTGGFKKRAFAFFHNLATTSGACSTGVAAPSLAIRLLCRLGDLLVSRPIRDKLGLRKTVHCLTGEGHLEPAYTRYFDSLGIRIRTVYCSSETGVVGVQHAAAPADGVDICEGAMVQISGEGEVLVAGTSLCSGYANGQGAMSVVSADDFVRTGDAGCIDTDGRLAWVGRLKNLRTLGGGQRYDPVRVQSNLRFSRYIREAMVSHDDAETALKVTVQPDLAALAQWADRRGIAGFESSELPRREEVAALLREEILAANKTLDAELKIGTFEVLPGDGVEVDGGESRGRRNVWAVEGRLPR